jgi:hypothetical protein
MATIKLDYILSEQVVKLIEDELRWRDQQNKRGNQRLAQRLSRMSDLLEVIDPERQKLSGEAREAFDGLVDHVNELRFS